MKRIIVCIATFLMIPAVSYAMSNETWSWGFLGGITTSNQADMNSMITRANTRVGGISTPQFSNAWEFSGYAQRRLNQSVLALQLRPSYYFNSVSGSGVGGSFNYSVSGYTVMPLFRAFILENQSVKLFLQGGIGWGSLSGKIEEAGATVKFSGSNFGFQGGIGVEFCFGQKEQHCLITEGNMRYMSIDRNTTDDVNGTFAAGSLSQVVKGAELEIDNHDFGTTMSGIQANIGYQYNF